MHCCCTLHTYQYMLCIAAVHYIHINTCYALLLYTAHISTHAMHCCCTLHTYQHMLCIAAVHYTHINTCYALLLYTTHIATHAMYCFCTLHTYQHILCFIAIVDCTDVHTCQLQNNLNIPILLLLLAAPIYGQLQLPRTW